MLFKKVSIVLGLFLLAVNSALADGIKCEDNHECADIEFCKKVVGECSGKGVCTKKSEICPMNYQPVCGCDKKTYSNSCNSESKGVSVLSDGECS